MRMVASFGEFYHSFFLLLWKQFFYYCVRGMQVNNYQKLITVKLHVVSKPCLSKEGARIPSVVKFKAKPVNRIMHESLL